MPSLSVTHALKAQPGSEATVRGWVRTRRDSKAGFSFIALNDGSCFDALQLVAPTALANYQSEVLHLTTGCSIEATGTLVQSQGKGQSVEMQVTSLRVLGMVEDPDTYPVSPKRHTMEYLRDFAHLRVRTNTFGAVARVRHCLAMAVHRFFHERGFFWVHTPIITASDAEGAGEMFRVSTLDSSTRPTPSSGTGLQPVSTPSSSSSSSHHPDFSQDFFGKEAFLTVSGQLNVETYACALSKVYTFGPTFRAENSNTARHLAEFWMIEPEIAFADIHDDMNLAEEFIKYLFKAALDERPDDMSFFNEHIDKTVIETLIKVIDSPFERVTYTDAVKILEQAIQKGKKFEYPVKWGANLQAEHEKHLTEEVFKRPVIVRDYPKEIKAFYMRLNDDGKTVAAMDVLAPGIGEIIGGSQREERLNVLDQRLDEMKLPKEAYWWYRDLRKYGTVPHCGFGLGFERLILACTGMQNIRDVIPFPRTPGNAKF
jgi:asparaginyl-tRNA synthetase